MAKVDKMKSSKSAAYAKGGSGHMFSEREAGPQKPGQAASEGQDGPETQFAQGGKTKMFGKRKAYPREPGMTGGC